MLFPAPLTQAQETEPADSLVRLISAEMGKSEEIGGEVIRTFTGNARFFHNNTYLLCDTALWNVDRRIIQALGHVRIIQDQTYLTSEKLDYIIDEDLAQFRGGLVELRDKDNNLLRTRHLDYNTADSVAIFQNGASMRDKDGQIIESDNGTYDSKLKTFTFSDEVNMFSDSVFIRSTKLIYRSDLSTAFFGFMTDVWQEDNMLSSNDGWYNRETGTFFFRDHVHMMSEAQEGWSDSLYFYRPTRDIDMYGHAAVIDTTRDVAGLAGHINYSDSLSRIRMTRSPAIAAFTREKERTDTVWVGADTLIYKTIRRCDIPESTLKATEQRSHDLSSDAIAEYRHRAAVEAAAAAAAAAAEAAKNDPNARPDISGKTNRDNRGGSNHKDVSTPQPSTRDTLTTSPTDTLITPPVDTTVTPPVDTTKIGFITGQNRVRVYRHDMQAACDSLVFNELDSLVRMYKSPVIWNEDVRQYSADSVFIKIEGRHLRRANLQSNAFIITQESDTYFDQIRATELIAYFDTTSALTRFDGLGGVNALFYLEENDVLATVNKVEAKMLYATFNDGKLDRIYYYETAKNDGYPIVQLPESERKLRGFNWQPDLQPKSKADITPFDLPVPERTRYNARPKAAYRHTATYFPGYMDNIYREIAIRDSLAKIPVVDTVGTVDTVVTVDTVDTVDTVGTVDTTATAIADSIAVIPAPTVPVTPAVTPTDTTSVTPTVTPTVTAADTIPALSPREQARLRRRAEREARWARADSIDAAKAALKAEKKKQKERARKLKQLKRIERQAEEDARTLKHYIQIYERKKARKEEASGTKEAEASGNSEGNGSDE